jgi:hypothetical protein
VIIPISTEEYVYLKIKQKAFKRKIWDFSNVSIVNINAELSSINWEECCLDELHIDEVYANWFRCFENIVKKHIPSRTVEIRPKDKPWFTSEIRKAIRKRNRLLKKHWVKKTTFTWQRYKVQRKSTTSLIRDAKISYYQKLNIQLSDSMLSSKKSWGLVRKTLSTNISSSIPPIQEGTEYIVDSKQKADLFNNFFASQAYVDDTGKSIPVSDYQQNQSYLTLIETTKEEVQVLIGSVNISKACGHDGIGNRILKGPFTRCDSRIR